MIDVFYLSKKAMKESGLVGKHFNEMRYNETAFIGGAEVKAGVRVCGTGNRPQAYQPAKKILMKDAGGNVMYTKSGKPRYQTLSQFYASITIDKDGIITKIS